MIALRSAMFARKSTQLPYDAEVEYLESTGTQYIDTGLIHSVPRYEYVIDFTPLQNDNATAVMGSGKNGAWDGVSYINSLYIGNKAQGIPFGRVANERQTTRLLVEDNYYTLFKNGEIRTARRTFDGTPISGFHILLFAYTFGSNNPTGRSIQRVHSFKLTMDGVLSADYIPVRKDGVGYMYDRVSKQLFGNLGTGSFIIGPDK